MIDVVLITKNNYPTIFKAFELISHDQGNQAGHINYAIPIVYEKDLSTIESDLKKLLEDADSDFECLCIGDIDEAVQIVKGYGLELSDELLQRFHEGFS